MIRERRFSIFGMLGLGVLCLGLAYNAIISRSQPVDGRDQPRLDTSSIGLTTGTGNATLSAHDMAPGDAVTAPMTIANSGRQPMTYAMSPGLVSAGGAALAAALVLTVKTVGSSCDDFDGTTLFDGPLNKAAFGSEGNGRLLPAATADILCFRAELPLDAGDALQGAATTIALSFSASSQAAVR